MPFQSSFSLPPLGNRGELDVILFLRNETRLFLGVKALWAEKSKISSSIETSSPLHNRDYGVIKSGVTYIVDVVGVGAICKTV